jgi:acetyltransferase
MGPVLLFGLGGIFTEVMKDFSLRVCPVNQGDVREMIREIKGFKLLEGFRGSPPADVNALEKALLNVSQLAMATKDQIKEIDINPLLVMPKGQGVRAIDALFIKA